MLASMQGIPALIDHALGVARSNGATETMLDPIIRLSSALRANERNFGNPLNGPTNPYSFSLRPSPGPS